MLMQVQGDGSVCAQGSGGREQHCGGVGAFQMFNDVQDQLKTLTWTAQCVVRSLETIRVLID